MHTYLLYILKMIGKKNQYNSKLFTQTYGRNRQKQKNKNNVAPGNKTPNKTTMFYTLYVILSGFSKLINRFQKAPHSDKYAVQNTSSRWKNTGSATMEAICIMPLMLFAFWAFYSMGQIFILENQVYQAAMNTAGYLAEYAYLAEEGGMTDTTGTQLLGIGMANGTFRYYLEDKSRVEQYVADGVNGLWITGTELMDKEGFIRIQIRYRVRIPIPFMSNLSMPVRVQVRQKAYVGYRENGTSAEEERYVYVTEYSRVYHATRSCSHLSLTIIPVSEGILRSSYSELLPCAYCGDASAEAYYITATGDCFHTSSHCTGLKRTVRRIKISEVSGYAPCSRCGTVFE